jgi:hypothetical protein
MTAADLWLPCLIILGGCLLALLVWWLATEGQRMDFPAWDDDVSRALAEDNARRFRRVILGTGQGNRSEPGSR